MAYPKKIFQSKNFFPLCVQDGFNTAPSYLFQRQPAAGARIVFQAQS
jgi:hypothetical protein